MGIVAIDGPTAATLRSSLGSRKQTRQIILNIKAFGKSLGGVDLESGEFQQSVKVCNGCLVSFAGANDPAQAPNPNCLAALGSTGSSGSGQLPCFAGQEESVPCQLCYDAKDPASRPACDPASNL
jgi:hypothetical protein